MEFVTITLSLFMATVVLAYDEKFDKIDINKILSDDALLMSYVNCFLDKGPCTAEYASDYKGMLPEVLSDACAKCTKIQKANLKKILNELYKNKKEVLLEVQKKFDPKNEYTQNIKKIMEED